MIEMFFVMYGNTSTRSLFSSVLAMGDKSDMGGKFVPMLWSLFGFGMGMIVARFQRWDVLLV